jgi:arylsulfatase
MCALGCGASEPPIPAQPNIVIFMLDAARADHFGIYGYDRPTTPQIDAFARTATRYTRAVAEGSFTFASASALFSGLPPDRTGLLKARRLGDDLVLFAEIAQRAGYRTHAYSENPYVTAAFGFDRGFQRFDAVLSYQSYRSKLQRFEHSDALPGIDQTLRFMTEEPGVPFLAYVHLLRPHNPYTPPDGFAGRFGSLPKSKDGSTKTLFAIDRSKREAKPRRLANIRALYDENLAYGDAMFGRLLDGMRDRDLLDDTIIIVLSDHGEAFLEHGRLLHGSTTFDEMIRVPLLIRVPGEKARVVDHPVQLADLGRALRDVVTGPGVSLERLVGLRRAVDDPTLSWSLLDYHRVCARTPRRKLIADTRSLEAVAYYDLESDPGELTTLPLDDEGARLLELLRTRIREGHASLTKSVGRPLDPALLDHLRALGYTED